MVYFQFYNNLILYKTNNSITRVEVWLGGHGPKNSDPNLETFWEKKLSTKDNKKVILKKVIFLRQTPFSCTM